jgi:ABC-type uncharacterized transport system substrate-binding protein
MRRREFVTLMSGVAALWPLSLCAQQSTLPVIGFLRNSSPDAGLISAFQEGLNEAGFREGQTVTIDYRWAKGNSGQLSEMAAALVRERVAVIVTGGDDAIIAAKSSTATIPIIFASGEDPIKAGYVTSLQPNGNLTGATFYSGAILQPKQLELLHELLPKAVTIAYLINGNYPRSYDAESIQAGATSLGLQLAVFNVTSEPDLEPTFASMAQAHVDAVVVAGNVLFTGHRAQLVALAERYKLPAIYNQRGFAAAGGLMSYGSRISSAYREAGVYAGQILKGKKPTDLPIIQPTKFEFVINLTTAKALGLTIPPSYLSLADDLIE